MPRKRLEDKVAFITGAGSGIGRAAARLFASRGARVAAVDRDDDAGHETVETIERNGGRALFSPADVSDAGEVSRAVWKTTGRLDGLDIMVNAVGVSGRKWGDGPTAECTEEAWDNVMRINLKSTFLCCKYGLQEMEDAGRGAIINIASVLGMVGGDEDFATHAYAASKGGIISLTRSIATYYAEKNIRANVICPGLIATSMSERAQNDPKIRRRLPELQPLSGDFGEPEDVAHAALYLASDEAKFVTGTVFPVDGGWAAR
jgi:NAD(P)-dependent dehydrogenase (short-subunit alcohol dehydrogenase family)